MSVQICKLLAFAQSFPDVQTNQEPCFVGHVTCTVWYDIVVKYMHKHSTYKQADLASVIVGLSDVIAQRERDTLSLLMISLAEIEIQD